MNAFMVVASSPAEVLNSGFLSLIGLICTILQVGCTIAGGRIAYMLSTRSGKPSKNRIIINVIQGAAIGLLLMTLVRPVIINYFSESLPKPASSSAKGNK